MGSGSNSSSWVWVQPGLQSEFQANQIYTVGPCLKKVFWRQISILVSCFNSLFEHEDAWKLIFLFITPTGQYFWEHYLEVSELFEHWEPPFTNFYLPNLDPHSLSHRLLSNSELTPLTCYNLTNISQAGPHLVRNFTPTLLFWRGTVPHGFENITSYSLAQLSQSLWVRQLGEGWGRVGEGEEGQIFDIIYHILFFLSCFVWFWRQGFSVVALGILELIL